MHYNCVTKYLVKLHNFGGNIEFSYLFSSGGKYATDAAAS